MPQKSPTPPPCNHDLQLILEVDREGEKDRVEWCRKCGEAQHTNQVQYQGGETEIGRPRRFVVGQGQQ